MITIHIKGENVAINRKRIKKIIEQLPKSTYYHFLYEPELIIRVHNKDKKYVSNYLDKKKWKYETYAYPFSKKVSKWQDKKGYGEDRKSVTYIYRDEFIPLMNLESRFAIKSKSKDHNSIIERTYHTLLNSLGYDWATEARITNWLLAGRVNTIKKYEGDTGIITVICILIIFFTRVNRVLIKGLQ